jgi:hypothetical protein
MLRREFFKRIGLAIAGAAFGQAAVAEGGAAGPYAALAQFADGGVVRSDNITTVFLYSGESLLPTQTVYRFNCNCNLNPETFRKMMQAHSRTIVAVVKDGLDLAGG